MRAHWLQHVAFEGLGSIEPWLHANDYSITCTRLYLQEALPAVDDIDLLVIMGGPMSVNDEHHYPWLVAEKQFVRAAIKQGVAVLGICLGAQLIASAMGARVYANRHKEIGWLPIYAVPHGHPGAFCFPETAWAFHWHGETFDLPSDAVHLAKTAACAHQAFQLGRRVIGLQFHLEATLETTLAMVSHCSEELVPAEFVQTRSTILSADAQRYRDINMLMACVLEYLQTAVMT